MHMPRANLNTKGNSSLNMPNEPMTEINSISNLPKITSIILPEEFELLPNASEVFELELAFYEHKFLTSDEIIRICVLMSKVKNKALKVTILYYPYPEELEWENTYVNI